VRINASPFTFIEKPGIEFNVFTARFCVKLLAVLTIDPNRVLVLITDVLIRSAFTLFVLILFVLIQGTVIEFVREITEPPRSVVLIARVLIVLVLRAGVTTVVATLTFDALRVVVLAQPRISVFPPINTLDVVERVSVKRRTVEIVLPVKVLAMYPTVL
jgi:hypothetical protein